MKINFEKIKKGLTKAAQKTKETSETMVEAAKLKYKLVEIKSDIDDNYMMIGKLVYEASDDEDTKERISEISEDITSLIEARDDMQQKLNELINKKQCPECGTKMEKDFEFCPKCGHNFEE